MFLYKKNIWFILGNLILLYYWATFWWTSTFLLTKLFQCSFQSTLNQRNSINVVSTLFCQSWNNVDKHTSAQLSFSIKFQRWNNVGSSTLNRRNSINVVSMLFCQRWNNVDKCTSAQLSFQRNINVETTLMNVDDQRCFNVDWTLMCLLGL